MDSPFLNNIGRLLIERGLQVSRFEFEYMAARRGGGKRRPPPRAELLMPEYRYAVEEFRASLPPGADGRLIIGGKSMGGRVASLVADELFSLGAIDGLVCLGYPFHPPGKPDNLRTAHLAELQCPALIVQGERDPFGTRAEITGEETADSEGAPEAGAGRTPGKGYDLSSAIRFAWIPDGDHDFAPRRGSGFTRAGNLALAADAVATFASNIA
jgi:predicted alpha/beta-hydrolase family hydrolase